MVDEKPSDYRRERVLELKKVYRDKNAHHAHTHPCEGIHRHHPIKITHASSVHLAPSRISHKKEIREPLVEGSRVLTFLSFVGVRWTYRDRERRISASSGGMPRGIPTPPRPIISTERPWSAG